jgi:hypothetical protein
MQDLEEEIGVDLLKRHVTQPDELKNRSDDRQTADQR